MSVGLDCGSNTVKIVELTGTPEKPQLRASGIVAHKYGPVESLKDEKDMANYAGVIKKLFNDSKIRDKNVCISIPESQVFTRTIRFPLLSEQEVAAAIKWEAEEYIPMPVTEAIIQHQIVERRENTSPPEVLVLLVAVSKSTIETYMKVATIAGLNVVAADTSMLSVSRALGRPGQTSIVLDIGGRATDIGIIKNGQLALSRSVPTAGYAFTRAVAQGVGISEIQAEEYKKTYGLDQTQLEGKVGSALAPVFKVITDEVRKAIHYYQGESGGDLPTSLILIGAGAGLPGVVSTLSKSLNFEVSIGNPFQNIAIDKTVVGNVESYAPLYTQAIGLALRFD